MNSLEPTLGANWVKKRPGIYVSYSPDGLRAAVLWREHGLVPESWHWTKGDISSIAEYHKGAENQATVGSRAWEEVAAEANEFLGFE